MASIRYMIHFYNSSEYLFQTVTMHGPEERDAIFDALTQAESWFWGRFQPSERAGYMAQRVAVESMLRSEFQAAYWPLRSQVPVYFDSVLSCVGALAPILPVVPTAILPPQVGEGTRLGATKDGKKC